MKSKYVFQTALAALLVSASVNAATGLEGEYKFKGYECSSGVAAKSPFDSPFDSSEGWEGWGESNLDMSVSFSANQLTSNVKLNSKMSATKGQELIQQYQAIIAQMNQIPDSPQKQQSLDDMNKAIENVKELVAGSSCSINFTSNYEVKGNKIHTVPVSSSGTCKMGKSQEDEAEFTAVGNTLKITSPSKDICPSEDTTFITFERVR